MIRIRPATYDDYPLIKIYDAFLDDRRLDIQAARLTVADYGTDHAIGYACIDPTDFMGWPLLSRLCVAPDMRGKGAASTLLQSAVSDGRYLRLYTTTENDNDRMHRLLKAQGAIQIGHADNLNFAEKREILYRLK